LLSLLSGNYSFNVSGLPVLVCGALILSLGIFTVLKNIRSQSNIAFSVLCLTLTVWLLGMTMVYFSRNEVTALFWGRVCWVGLVFIGSAVYFLSLSMTKIMGSHRNTLIINFAISFVFCIAVLTTDRFIDGMWKYSWGYHPRAAVLYYFYLPFFFWQLFVSINNFYLAYKHSDSGLARQQIRLVLIAFGIAYTASIDYLPNLGYNVYPFGYLPIFLFTVIIFYSIVKYKLWDISTVIHKTAMWAAISSLVLIPIGGLFYFGYSWIDSLSPVKLSFLIGALALLLIPYVRVIQPEIDHLFQRRKYDLQKILQDFIHEIVILKGLDDLVNKLQTTISSVLYPETTSIILFDVKSDEPKPFRISGLTRMFPVERHAEFLKWLERTNAVAELDLIEADSRYSGILESAKQYFQEVQGKLVVPLTHDDKLLGLINLGQKRNLKPYTQLDLDFLSNLKVEASIAFSNSLLYDDVSKMSLELKEWATELEHKVEDRTRELAESKLEVEKAYEKLKELDRLKTEFFANVSHELRSPLTLIMAPLESLIKGELGRMPQVQEQHAEIMYQNSLRLLKLINNLLDLAKIDAGKMELYLSKVHLSDFIKGIVASVQPMAEKKQIDLSFTNGEDLPKVACDQEKIEKVLLNLIFNSLKFTEPGGKVTVSCGRDLSAGRQDNGRVYVKVVDTGIGIPDQYLGRIFERFSQVDASSSRKHQGTGIGLALVKELVELHKGRVKAESELGRGTVMTVTLPMNLQAMEEKEALLTPAQIERRNRNRRKAEGRREEDWTKTLHHAADYSAADLGLDSPQISPSDEPTGRTISAPRSALSHRVLVVEDNADMLNFIAFQLKDEYAVLTARDGFEGVETAKLSIPDLIVSDVMMPGKDGYQLCREIKADSKTRHIPIILLTAKAELSEKISGLEHGADDYLTKPFNAQELRAKIKSLISLRGLEREIQLRSEELEKTLKELQETQAQLVHSAKMASVGYLAAGMAHEINNPISFAKGSLNNLKRCLEEAKGHFKDAETVKEMDKAFSIIQTGLERTEQIVLNLKSFARKDETAVTPQNLHEGLDATLDLLTHSLGDRITVHKEYGPIGPVEVVSGQINQVFMNLLLNAAQAIPDRGDIWIRTEKVNSPSGERVMISVKDNGVGIKAEHLDKIFDPFFTTKEVGKGMGLGLSISYKIIEGHGGKIEAKSQEGSGTEMIIYLPVTQKRF
jgi:signal transduction histidine kinase